MAASFIERLPDESDPQRSIEEAIAKNVAWIAYVGTYYVVYAVNLGCPADFFIAPAGLVSAGADTVSRRKRKYYITNCIIRLYHPFKRYS